MRKILRLEVTLLLVSLFVSSALLAQERSIKGTVLSADNKTPLGGVSVIVKNTSNATQTDATGNFEITAGTGQILQFSYVGFNPQEIVVGQENTISISLSQQQETLSDVVVVGYGRQKRANLTGAVSTVDVDKTLRSRPITDVARGLQGTTPGLTITTTSGQPGSNPVIRLRGISGSLNSGTGTQPLILVDNVEMQNLQMVNPEDIESISVLKDAASTSIYGTRGAWGVILITTKSGRKNAPAAVNYSNNFSWNKPTTMAKAAEPIKGTQTILSSLRRTTNNPNATQYGVLGMYFDEIGIQKMKDWIATYGGQNLGNEMVMGRDLEIRDGKLFFYRPWDPIDMYLKEYAGQQKHDVSVSGGSEKTTYHLGLGYLNQGGFLKVNPDKFDRYNLSLGVNSTVNKWLDIRTKTMFSQSITTYPFSFSGASLGPWAYLTRWPSVYPYGTLDGKPFRSALTEVQQAKMDNEKSTFARVQVGGTLKIAKDLTFDADYTYSNTNLHIHSVGGGTSGIDFWGGTLNYLQNYQSVANDRVRYTSYWENMHTGRAFVTYKKGLKDHTLQLIAGGDMDLFQYWQQVSERRTIMDPDLGEISLTTGDQFASGLRGHWATNGYFARINYDFKNTFLLELNGRYDGSSRFPASDQFAFFPSVSAGYILSNEKYMDFSRNILSFLKLRASWGSVGNQNVGNNSNPNLTSTRFLSVMSSGASNWLVGSTNLVTVGTPGPVSPILTWETISTLDFGVDARFLNNKLGVSFDWYQRTTSDMITAGLTVPSTFGASPPPRNFGEMQTTGWELAVDFTHTFSNGLHISGNAVLSDFKEKITRFANVTKGVYGNYEGRTLGEIWGYQTDRLFDPGDFVSQNPNGSWVSKAGIADQSALSGNSTWFYYGPGDVKYKDINGDGKIDFGTNTVGNSGDLSVIGNSTPRYQYGLTLNADWKGFDFSIFFQGVGKRDLWPNGPVFIPGWRQAEVWYDHQMDYWTPDNPNAYYARPTNYEEANSQTNSKNFFPQSRYLLDMSYLKIKNLALGYTIPKRISSRILMSKLRVYAAAENLVTWTKLQIPIDPEIDYTPNQDPSGFGRTYPQMKRISIGVQVTF